MSGARPQENGMLAGESTTGTEIAGAKRRGSERRGMLAQTGVDPTGGGVLAVVVTLLVAWLFYAVTLHLAATFFIGEVPSQRAAYAGAVPAVVSVLLRRWGVESVGFVSPSLGVAIVILATLVADAVAISSVYRISWTPTAALTALHFAFATVLGFALNNIFGLV